MSLTERLLHLIVQAQAKAEALEHKAANVRQASAEALIEEQRAKKDLDAARDRLAACRLALVHAREERDRHLADLREQCQRLGVEAPDAS